MRVENLNAENYSSLLAAGVGADDVAHFTRSSKRKWKIVTAENVRSAVEFLRKEEFNVILYTGGISGAEESVFLYQACRLCPDAVLGTVQEGGDSSGIEKQAVVEQL